MLNNTNINCAEVIRYLGVYIDKNLTWENHILHISKIISRNVGIISRSRYFLSHRHRFLLYNSLVLPYLNYCCMVWGNTTQCLLNKLFLIQKKIIRIIDGQPRLAHTNPIFQKLNILKVKDIAKQQAIVVLYNVVTQNAPSPISSLFESTQPHVRSTRVTKHFEETFTRKLYRIRTILWQGPRLWNTIITPIFPDRRLLSQVSRKQVKDITKKPYN